MKPVISNRTVRRALKRSTGPDGSCAADSNVLYLNADPSRLTPAVDPDSRQTVVSQGAFLAYLRVAAEQLGYSASFELFPDGSYDEADLKKSMSQEPVARVTLAKDAFVTTNDYSSLFLSDTNRAPFTVAPLTTAQTEALTAATTEYPASMRRDVASLLRTP